MVAVLPVRASIGRRILERGFGFSAGGFAQHAHIVDTAHTSTAVGNHFDEQRKPDADLARLEGRHQRIDQD